MTCVTWTWRRSRLKTFYEVLVGFTTAETYWREIWNLVGYDPLVPSCRWQVGAESSTMNFEFTRLLNIEICAELLRVLLRDHWRTLSPGRPLRKFWTCSKPVVDHSNHVVRERPRGLLIVLKSGYISRHSMVSIVPHLWKGKYFKTLKIYLLQCSFLQPFLYITR